MLCYSQALKRLGTKTSVTESRVFNYRGGGPAFVVCFLWIWACGWLYGVISNWSNPKVMINNRPATPDEAVVLMWVSLVIGIAVAILAIVALGYILFCRIEVEHGYISWYDWRGKLKVRSTVEHTRLDEMNERSVKAYIDSPDGTITVRNGLNDYGQLKHMLDGDQPLRPYQGFLPPATAYHYRFSYAHVFSFVWLGAVGFMAYSALTDKQQDARWFALALIPFAAIGVWLQLTGWVERIIIGPQGFVWIDCFGRTRVRAQLNQLVSTDVSESRRSASLQIHTTVGTIRASSYLWNWRHLLSMAERVVHDAENQAPA